MVWTQWRADCTACAALCCHHLAFDAGEDFAHDKEAGKSCRHLAGRDCVLHGQLTEQGYGGCARYDCAGAGQRATALGGAAETFAALRRLHDDHLMLMAACDLPLPEPQRAQCQDLLTRLDAGGDLTLAEVQAYAQGPLPAQVRGFLRGLKASLPPHR